MAGHQFSAAALIDARPDELYAILADYQHSHPEILPKPPFVSLAVEQGGVGAGTVIVVQMRVMGRLQSFRAEVIEPEPGRVLMETTDTGYVTTVTVEPRVAGQQAYVTIATEITKGKGMAGAIERFFVPRMLQPVYVRELAQLAAYAASRAA